MNLVTFLEDEVGLFVYRLYKEKQRTGPLHLKPLGGQDYPRLPSECKRYFSSHLVTFRSYPRFLKKKSHALNLS